MTIRDQSKQPRRGPMGGPPGMMRGDSEKARNFKGTMSRLLKTLRPYTGMLIIAFIFAIASTIFSIIEIV